MSPLAAARASGDSRFRWRSRRPRRRSTAAARTSATSIPPAAGRARRSRSTVGGQFLDGATERLRLRRRRPGHGGRAHQAARRRSSSTSCRTNCKELMARERLRCRAARDARRRTAEARSPSRLDRRGREADRRDPQEAGHVRQTAGQSGDRRDRHAPGHAWPPDAAPGERELRLRDAARAVQPAGVLRRPAAGVLREGRRSDDDPSTARARIAQDRRRQSRKPRARDGRSRCRPSSTARSCPATWTATASRPARASSWSSPPARGS